MSLSSSEIRESNEQFIAFSKVCVHSTATPHVVELPGLVATFADSPLSFLNNVFFTSPLEDLADLERRARAAHAFAAPRRVPWMLAACHDWLPAEGVEETLSRVGFVSVMPMAGMVADHGLLPPPRDLPRMELRRIDDDETAHTAGAINCISYDIPVEAGRDSVCRLSYFDGERQGFLGYVDGIAVATATTCPIDGRLYVAAVATLPAYRRRGYADVVMRHSIEQAMARTGLSRIILHATGSGYQVYERMGFRTVARFTYYAPAGNAAH